MTVVSGWILDTYSLGDRIVVWIKTEDGEAVRLEDDWTPSFYVAADKESDLHALTQNKDFVRFVKRFDFVSKYERTKDHRKSKVLKVNPLNSTKANMLAETIWMLGDYGQHRLYNADLLPAQSYFFEHNIFPLAFCEVEVCGKSLEWKAKDDVWDTDYKLPNFRTIYIEVKPRKKGKIRQSTDRIDSIVIRQGDKGGRTIVIKNDSEVELLNEFMSAVAKLDPDFIFTSDGDSFEFPYMIRRARENGIELYLSREKKVKLTMPNYEGNKFSQYGKVQYKPAKIELLGRIHLDSENSFVYQETGLHGFYEIARVCRLPLHTAFRASIGKCLTSLQCYYATKDDYLVPWQPDEAEHVKTLEQLFIADRGGLYLVPKLGVHERVAEFDFASLFPTIMHNRNISAETVGCDCCPDSKNVVPELNVHVCEKRKGIVPKSLEIVIEKKAAYKVLKKLTQDETLIAVYDSRQKEYKWIGVTSFGYQGYSNAKNGLIDSHQLTCADARTALFIAKDTAENHDYQVIDGIVDSLFVKKEGVSIADYLQLKDAIERVTTYPLSFEGEYKWIAFLPSKRNEKIPVQNCYFGVFQDGTIKVRGIAIRRRDTPPLFAKIQSEILQIMAMGNNIAEVKALMPQVQSTFDKYVAMLRERKVPVEELVFTKQVSKDADDYDSTRHTVEISSINQLTEEGKSLKAGQVLRYVITNFYRRHSGKRSIPLELIDEKTGYDVRRYVELLAEVCNVLTGPFGYTMDLQSVRLDLF